MKEIITKVYNMSKIERNQRLCQLAVKDTLGDLSFEEEFELNAIQAVRLVNGEIDKVLADREKNKKYYRL